MHQGVFPLVLVFQSFLWALTRGDIRISCDLGETCVLPCSFKYSDWEVIHWTQEEPVKVAAHSYYSKKDQLGLQDKRFQGRTSLFLDQLSMGNASLQLRKVEIEDEGKYRCYTSTKAGQEHSFIQLEVNAPVLKVSVVRTGDRALTCTSEGIYPEPKLTWSTMPPSDVSLLSNPTVAQSKEKLYNISCLLTLTSKNLNPSCTVETRRNKKTMTLMERINQHSYDETILTCTLPAEPLVTLVWRFGPSEEILRQDSNKDPLVSDKWKKHFVKLLDSGDLILKELTAKENGLYTCEASNSEETLISDTFLNIEELPEPSRDKSGTIAGVLCGVTAGLLLISIMVFCLRRRQRRAEERTSLENRRRTECMRILESISRIENVTRVESITIENMRRAEHRRRDEEMIMNSRLREERMETEIALRLSAQESEIKEREGFLHNTSRELFKCEADENRGQ